MGIINFEDYIDRLPHAKEDLDAAMAQHVEDANNTADPELGGLTPSQVYHLMYTDWDHKDSPVKINPDLDLETLNSSSELFRQARDFLLLLREKSPVKATAKDKNMNRSFVEELMEVLLTKKECDYIREWNKAINELDVIEVHYLRVFLEVANLIKLRSGAFRVVKKYQYLLEPENAGELFKLLFTTYFNEFNIGYYDGDQMEAVQDGAPYTLYRLGEVAADWRDVDESLLSDILLPAINDSLKQECGRDRFFTPSRFLAREFLGHLIGWGIIEGRFVADKYNRSWSSELKNCRVTEFYHQAIEFDIGAVSNAAAPRVDDVLDRIATSEDNVKLAKAIMAFAQPLIDEFNDEDVDIRQIYRRSVTIWNLCVVKHNVDDDAFVLDLEDVVVTALGFEPLYLSEVEAMNLIEKMSKIWKSKFSTHTMIVAQHRLSWDKKSRDINIAVVSDNWQSIYRD